VGHRKAQKGTFSMIFAYTILPIWITLYPDRSCQSDRKEVKK
jgi:hypothetical protein